jgi:hypothetical protein
MTVKLKNDLDHKINAILSLHHGSLLRHIDEAKPHLSARTWKAWQQCACFQEHRQLRIHLLIRVLVEDLDKQPLPADFDQAVGFAHFLTLDALLPKVQSELETSRSQLTALLPTGKVAADDKIQSAIELCDQDLSAVKEALRLTQQTPSTLR